MTEAGAGSRARVGGKLCPRPTAAQEPLVIEAAMPARWVETTTPINQCEEGVATCARWRPPQAKIDKFFPPTPPGIVRESAHTLSSSVTRKLAHFLENVEPVGTTKPKIRRRKDLLLAASKENTGIFPKAMSPQPAKLGKV